MFLGVLPSGVTSALDWVARTTLLIMISFRVDARTERSCSSRPGCRKVFFSLPQETGRPSPVGNARQQDAA